MIVIIIMDVIIIIDIVNIFNIAFLSLFSWYYLCEGSGLMLVGRLSWGSSLGCSDGDSVGD